MICAVQIAVDQPAIICVKSRHVRHRSPAASVRIAMPSTVNLYRSLRVRANLEQNKSSENNPSYPSSHKFLRVTTASVPKKSRRGAPPFSRLLREGGEFDFRDENSPGKKKSNSGYGVPEGIPAICHENARNDDAVKSIAGSTVEYDCTKSLYTALPL